MPAIFFNLHRAPWILRAVVALPLAVGVAWVSIPAPIAFAQEVGDFLSGGGAEGVTASAGNAVAATAATTAAEGNGVEEESGESAPGTSAGAAAETAASASAGNTAPDEVPSANTGGAEDSDGASGTNGTAGDAGEKGSGGTPRADEEVRASEGTAGEDTPATQDGAPAAGSGSTSDEAEETPPPSSTSTEAAVITTGDATAEGTAVTAANLNEVQVAQTPAATSSPDSVRGDGENSEGGVASTRYSTTTTETEEYTASGATHASSTRIIEPAVASTTIAVEGDNIATTTTTASVAGTTGGNVAHGGARAIVRTGSARAVANVINVVNTNIVNSRGLMLFENLARVGDVDLTDAFAVFDADATAVAQSTCSLAGCARGEVSFSATTENDARIDNDVRVRAATGGNEVTARAGDAMAQTGDAYAAASVTNVANTNIVDSTYLLISMNGFGDKVGDIVFPGLDEFVVPQPRKPVTAGTVVSGNDNQASVENEAVVVADTGGNTTMASSGSAVALTGDAYAGASVVNQVNTNLFNTNSLFMLFRVFGTWTGNVRGLPDGLVWEETPQGIVIKSDPSRTEAARGTARAGAGGAYAVANDNRATVRNKVQVYALTGDNRVEAGAGDAVAQTGNAYAAASILNVVNTNVVGSNWVNAIFNIFGDWDGNVAFGLPNLWIGGTARAVEGAFEPGKLVEFTLRVTNFGDVPARGVKITPSFDERYLEFLEDEPEWQVGRLNAGESREVVRRARISKSINAPELLLTLRAEVRADENDADESDNTEEIAFLVQQPPYTTLGSRVIRQKDARLTLEKTVVGPAEITASTTASYQIKIKNTGGPAYHSLLTDTIYDEEGNPVYRQYWELDTIEPYEEIYITYDVFFNASTSPGVYTNEAYLEAIYNHPSLEKMYGKRVKTPAVKAQVTVVGPEQPAAEKAPVALAACGPYLREYIRYGARNNALEVAKLQQFLNQFEGQELKVSGIYDRATRRAVEALQAKYAEDVLYPWGITRPTGYVYYTTRKKINELYCKGNAQFPLSPAQLAEIARFRAKLEDEGGEDDAAIQTYEVGLGPQEGDAAPARVAQRPAPAAESRPTPSGAAPASLSAQVQNAAGGRSLLLWLKEKVTRMVGWLSLQYMRVLTMTMR